MTDEQFNNLKVEYIDGVKSFILDNGGIIPHLTVFADIKNPKTKEDEKPALIHIPISEKLMQDEEGQSKFVDEMFPEIAVELKKSFKTIALAFVSEGWIKSNKKSSSLEREIIVMTIQTNTMKESVIYEIKRMGKSINLDGDIVDTIKLAKLKNSKDGNIMESKFSGLFNKLKD